MHTTTLEQRKELELLYITLEVHTKIVRNYHVIINFSNLINLGGAIVLCLYIPLRHPEVPALLNLCFLLGIIVLGVCFW